MMFTAPIALYGWPLVVVALFAVMQPHRAILVAYFGAWLFLPMANFGFLNYDKWSAAAIGSLAGALIFTPAKLISWRTSWLDLPMAAWCIIPLVSHTFAGFGINEGIYGSAEIIIAWGIPYVLGRVYFRDQDTILELAKAFVIAGVIYVPFCWFEIRMSPRLHAQTYGFVQHEWHQLVRSGGYRPIVYMQHPIAVSGFLSFSLVAGWWLLRTKAMPKMWGYNTGLFLALIGVTLIACKTLNALFLVALGIALYYLIIRFPKWRWTLALTAALPVFYMGGKLTGRLGDELVLNVATQISAERARSLEQRLYSERVILDGIATSPLLGHGRWKTAAQNAEQTAGRRVIPDAYWVIVAGSFGLFGIAAFAGIFLVPVFKLCQKLPASQWLTPTWGSVAALMVVAGLYFVDALMNAMLSSVIPLVLGAMTSVAIHKNFANDLDATVEVFLGAVPFESEYTQFTGSR